MNEESNAASIERILLLLATFSFAWVLVPSSQIPALIEAVVDPFFSWIARASEHVAGYIGTQFVQVAGYVRTQIGASPTAVQVGAWALALFLSVKGVRQIKALIGAVGDSRTSA